MRQLERHGIEAQPHEAQALASEFEATPGVAAGATAAARRQRCGGRTTWRAQPVAGAVVREAA